MDVQACPGSGKTTVLVAKLAILSKKWPYNHKGICVLSHTNVAREEIEERLGQTDVGRKLLAYPHFIGTLHSFFNTFIAIPWIRSQGMPVNVIDSDFVLEKRWRKLKFGSRTYLQKNRFDENICEAKTLPLKLNIKCNPGTPTYKDLFSVITESHTKGEFSFNEMLLYSEIAINKYPFLAEIVQMRFPIVFVDEAQDTSSIQWKLLQKVFPDESVLSIRQGFGDINQAIYSSHYVDEQGNIFPRNGAVTMNNSKRFNSKIASFADSLSLNRIEMRGEDTKFDKNNNKHTIFLFDKNKIHLVIPAYAKHILNCFSDEELQENKKYGCHVIGMVHKNNEQSSRDVEKFPISLCDYWECYSPEGNGRSTNPHFLIEYFRIGRGLFKNKQEFDVLIDWISRGLRRYINANSNHRISATINAFRAIINEFSLEKQPKVRKELRAIALANIEDKEKWAHLVGRIRTLCDSQFEIQTVRDDILCWKENDVIDEGKSSKEKMVNFINYIDSESSRTINLHMGSIHSEKGRTHLATLVVETFWHDSNIKSILPWICGCPPKKAVQKRNATRLKCHYVALSRAKGLVCLAIPIDSVDESVEDKLIAQGWNIQKV